MSVNKTVTCLSCVNATRAVGKARGWDQWGDLWMGGSVGWDTWAGLWIGTRGRVCGWDIVVRSVGGTGGQSTGGGPVCRDCVPAVTGA